MIRTLGLCLLLALSSNIHAKPSSGQRAPKADKEMCENILTTWVISGLVEETCGFNGGVKDKFLRVYDGVSQCRQTLPEKEAESIIEEVVKDTKMRYLAYGESAFCENNLKTYSELVGE